jgi:formate hydrogenlyase subunit 4
MMWIGLFSMILAALIFPGITGIIKAKVGGRKAPPLLQPVYDAVRLFRKGAVYSTTTGLIFRLAPLVNFAAIVTVLFLIPFGGERGIISFEGDFVFFAYLLALGKFMMIIAAMDTGSGFEGMGANREALYSMLVEPAFFIVMGSLALFAGSISFFDLFNGLFIGTNLSYLTAVTATYVLAYIAMVENSRLPVDDPKTHLELTMVHEVMVLDYSGFDLALIHVANWLKFSIFGTLIANFLLPFYLPFYLEILLFFLVQIGFAASVGGLESFRARNKMAKNPQFIIMLSAIAILVFLSALIISQKFSLN